MYTDIFSLFFSLCVFQSTFSLPAVEELLRQFLPLEEAVLDLLRPQVDWAPPGYKPSDR